MIKTLPNKKMHFSTALQKHGRPITDFTTCHIPIEHKMRNLIFFSFMCLLFHRAHSETEKCSIEENHKSSTINEISDHQINSAPAFLAQDADRRRFLHSALDAGKNKFRLPFRELKGYYFFSQRDTRDLWFRCSTQKSNRNHLPFKNCFPYIFKV